MVLGVASEAMLLDDMPALACVAWVFLVVGVIVSCDMPLLVMLSLLMLLCDMLSLLMLLLVCASAAPAVRARQQRAADKIRDFMGISPVE